jgi:hypothetical protein
MFADAGVIEPVGVGVTVIVAVFDAGAEQKPLKIIAEYVPASVAL